MIRIALSFLFVCGFTTAAESADCGSFRVVKGDVVYKKNGTQKFNKARINKKVCQGDMIKTGESSRAKVVMADKNELNISPSTELIIEVYSENKKAVLNVLNGKVRSNVKQKYQDNKQSHYRIKTKSAVAGVRGTEFLAGYDRATNRSQVVTFEGEVALGRVEGGRVVAQVAVRAGHTSTASLGADPTPPQQVPPQELVNIDQESSLVEPPRGVSGEPGLDVDMDSEADSELETDSSEVPEGDTSEGNNPDSADNSLDSASPDIQDDSASGSSGERDVASVDNPDAFLPPPELDPVDTTTDMGSIEMPRIPTVNDPIINTIPDNQQINDSIINQNQKANVKVIINAPGN